MTRKQARIFVIGGLAMIGFGFVFSGPSVPSFWLWLTMPCIMIAGGAVRLLRQP